VHIGGSDVLRPPLRHRKSSGFDSNGQILSEQPAYGKFITTNTSPWDWRSPQINTLWNSGTESSPIKTANDPCPAGWRVPTNAEFKNLVDSGSDWDPLKEGRYFGSGTQRVFFPAAGLRAYKDVLLGNVGSYGYYWSSTPNYSSKAYSMGFDSGDANAYGNYRSFGFSVRCVAE